MALYAIGDLHLCLSASKPMDIFGGAWAGYMDKLEKGLSVLTPKDTLVILGDLSWALGLEEATEDFAWINKFPGKKIIIKGNHDYWWSTAAKFDKFCLENKFRNIFSEVFPKFELEKLRKTCSEIFIKGKIEILR